MKLSDIANVVPGATVTTDNPLRSAIKAKRTATLKAALRQKKTNNPTSDRDPNVETGAAIENDPAAKMV